MEETNEQLLAMYRNVKRILDEGLARMKGMKPGPGRTRAAMSGGGMVFTLREIESKMKERGIKVPN